MTQTLEPMTTELPNKPGPVRGNRRFVISGAVVALVVLVVLVVVWASGGSKPAARVGATEQDFSLQLSRSEVTAGSVRLRVANAGPSEHELVAFRTDLPEGALPMTGERVDEEGAGVTHLDPEAENIKAGHSKEITLKLDPGRYVLICNIAGHFQRGMHAVLTVR